MTPDNSSNPAATTPHEASRREKMFEAEMTNQQLGQLQEYLGSLAKQIAEIVTLKEEIDRCMMISDGDEMLVPVAAGVFLKARATAERTFLVNVGAGTVVPKDAPAVQKMLDEQLAEMREYESKIQGQFDQLLERLTQLQHEFEDASHRR